jgi:hypothetical protein
MFAREASEALPHPQADLMADILMGGFVPKREVAGAAHEQREIQMICQGKWQINANTIC